jgi:hypothetical protein
MRVMILSADYPRFLRDLYLSRPGLSAEPYAVQMAARNDSLFGVADFYSRNFRAHGHEAEEFHINNCWLQHAWARENGLDILPLEPAPQPADETPVPSRLTPVSERVRSAAKPLKPVIKPLLALVARAARRARQAPGGSVPGFYPKSRRDWEHAVLREQIRRYKPDLILNQELAYLPSSFFRTARIPGMLLVGQIASSMPEHDSFEGYDLMISSLPNQVEWFRKRGLRAELNRLAFEPALLEKLGPAPARDIEVSFVGSLSADHGKRIEFLEHVAGRAPLKVWGSGIERLPRSSPLHGCYQGEAWGRDMYEVMRRSRITLNFHIDLADGWANNLRLYEATGVGTLLLTDWKKNLHEMFVPGEEIVTYRDANDCVAQIHALLADEATRGRIAAAGQRQAIQHQNYYRRVGEIITLAEKLRSGA